VTVSLVMRAEIDANGASYLSVTDKAASVLQNYQNDLDATIQALQIDGVLTITGFQLAGGDAGADKQNRLWTWAQSIIVYGVISHN